MSSMTVGGPKDGTSTARGGVTISLGESVRFCYLCENMIYGR